MADSMHLFDAADPVLALAGPFPLPPYRRWTLDTTLMNQALCILPFKGKSTAQRL